MIDKILVLGILLISNNVDTTKITHRLGTVTVQPQAIALIDATQTSLAVYSMCQPKTGMVSVQMGTFKHTLAPTRFIVIGDQHTNIPSIVRFDIHAIDTNKHVGYFMISSTFTLPEVFTADDLTIDRLCKTVAVLER